MHVLPLGAEHNRDRCPELTPVHHYVARNPGRVFGQSLSALSACKSVSS